MSEKHQESQSFALPGPLELVRRAGSSMMEMVFNDTRYNEQLKREAVEQKAYEEAIVVDLGQRIANLDNKEQIEAAKRQHPSRGGYL